MRTSATLGTLLALLAVGAWALSAVAFAPTGDPSGDGQHASPGPLGPLHEIVPGVYSGGSPYEHPMGLDKLEELGIKTVISVDATIPEVAKLEEIGARSVHIPTRYSGFDPIQKLTLAKAVRDLPRPIYIHCHHGKHRGPAAAACALIGTGEITVERGDAFLHEAQTSPDYPGLWESVRDAKTYDDPTLDGFKVDFAAASEPRGMIEAMSVIDHSWYALGQIRAAGWRVPEDQPDLVPAAEAGIIHNTLRGTLELKDTAKYDELFAELLLRSVAEASELEQAIVRGDVEAIERAHRTLGASCFECHTAYRD